MEARLEDLPRIYGNKTPLEFREAFQALYHSKEFKIILNDDDFMDFFRASDYLRSVYYKIPKLLLKEYRINNKNEHFEALQRIINAIKGMFGKARPFDLLQFAYLEPEVAAGDCFFSFFKNFDYHQEEFSQEKLNDDGKKWKAVQDYLI